MEEEKGGSSKNVPKNDNKEAERITNCGVGVTELNLQVQTERELTTRNKLGSKSQQWSKWVDNIGVVFGVFSAVRSHFIDTP